MALLASPPPEPVSIDPDSFFTDYTDEAEDYKIAPDRSNVLVDLTVDNSVLGLEG